MPTTVKPTDAPMRFDVQSAGEGYVVTDASTGRPVSATLDRFSACATRDRFNEAAARGRKTLGKVFAGERLY